MDKVKDILRKAALVLILSLTTALGGQKGARAQIPTTDVGGIAATLAQTFEEVAKFLTSIGVSEDNLSWMEEMMDAWETLSPLLDDVKILSQMYQSLERQAHVYEYYCRLIMHMDEYGYNPALINRLYSQVEFSLKSVEAFINQALKILNDTGITKDAKVEFAKAFAKSIENKSQEEEQKLINSLDEVEAETAFLQVWNMLDGSDTNAGLGAVGVYVPYSEIERQSEKDVSMGSGMSEADKSETRLAAFTGFNMVLLVFGLLMLLSLIGITVRFMRGDPNAQGGFARLFVVMVAALLLVGVLSKVFSNL